MDSSRDFIEYKSLKDLNKQRNDIKEKDEYEKVYELKEAADKAFIQGKYKDAYELYNNALIIDSKNYEIITCKIGAALNLGYIDDVFRESETLIKLSDKKPQGYYLRGIAFDAIFKFEEAIILYIEALKYENDHQDVIIKSIKQTVAKYLDKLEILNERDPNINANTLAYLADLLVKNQRYKAATYILKYLEQLNVDDREIKLQIFINFGKIFKSEKKYDKAILSFEEAYYLACTLNNLHSKIEILIQMSTTYLEQKNMSNVIVYYHKLLDIENDLRLSTHTQINEYFNLNLRIAIRQNLFTANYYFCQYKSCCDNLKELIEILNETHTKTTTNPNPNGAKQVRATTIVDDIELVKLKFNAAFELARMYFICKDYIQLDAHLSTFILIYKENEATYEQYSHLKYYYIKLIAYSGISYAALYQMRMSKIQIKKAFSLIKKIPKFEDDEKLFELLEIECRLIASEAALLRNQIRKDMLESIQIQNPNYDKDFELSLTYLKDAYLQSKSQLSPHIRIECAFKLAQTLFNLNNFESSLYYFNEVISIIKTLPSASTGLTYESELQLPVDYKMSNTLDICQIESSIYVITCEILLNYTQPNELLQFEVSGNDTRTEELQVLLLKVQKLNKKLTKRINKNEKNEHFMRLYRQLNDTHLYILYELDKYEEFLYFNEECDYLTHTDFDYTSIKADDNKCLTIFKSFNDFKQLINYVDMPLIKYKFLFNCKFLYIFILEPKNGLVYNEKIKFYLTNNSQISNGQNVLFKNNDMDYLNFLFDFMTNDFILKNNLNNIEYRSVSGSDQKLTELRMENFNKEKNFTAYINTPRSSKKLKDQQHEVPQQQQQQDKKDEIESISDVTAEGNGDLDEAASTGFTVNVTKNDIYCVLQEIFIKPVKLKLNQYYCLNELINICCDEQYCKLLTFTLNLSSNKTEYKIPKHLLTLNSFVLYTFSTIYNNYLENETQKRITKLREQIINGPERVQNSFNTPGLGPQRVLRIDKENIDARLTSNPRLAVKMLNDNPKVPFIEIKESEMYEHLIKKYDTSVNTLISSTVTGTNVKTSNLEVLDYYQLTNELCCLCIGCTVHGHVTIQQNRNFEELCDVARLLNCEPVHSANATKYEFLSKLTSATIAHLTILTTNEQNSKFLLSKPTSHILVDSAADCVVSVSDLNQLQLENSKLIVLSCYAMKQHRVRFELALKLLKRGCRNILIILTPLPNLLLIKFFKQFYKTLKDVKSVCEAYHTTIQALLDDTYITDVDKEQLYSAFCLIGSTNIEVAIDSIGKIMLQTNLDKLIDATKVNLTAKSAAPIYNMNTDLERQLQQIQINLKQLLNEFASFYLKKDNNIETCKSALNDLLSLIAKSIDHMKDEHVKPDKPTKVISNSKTAINILKLLGFTFQASSIYLDEKNDSDDVNFYNKPFITYPNARFLDLNIRANHVIGSINDLCFSIAKLNCINTLVYFEQMMPFNDKKLLSSLIDIFALTKFSPEILLSVNDSSVDYCVNYRKNFMKIKYEPYSLNGPVNLKDNYLMQQSLYMNNVVVNYLNSIGYETIGTWLRFKDVYVNRILLDYMLKVLSSLSTDRDMSLYKELNVNVFGQRSASISDRPMLNTTNSLYAFNTALLPNSNLCIVTPWASVPESQHEMLRKIQFIDKFKELSKRKSAQRVDALRHHLNYIDRQHLLNERKYNENFDGFDTLDSTLSNGQSTTPAALRAIVNNTRKSKKKNPIKYQTGGGPTVDRKVLNEPVTLALEQFDGVREYSHFLCRKQMEKIDNDFNEKLEKLVLPFIKKNFKQNT